MPELPEIEVLTSQLAVKLSGLVISEARFPNRDLVNSSRSLLEKVLPQKRIQSLKRRGKFIGILLDGGFTLWLHLGMTGRLLVREAVRKASAYDQMVVGFEGSDVEFVFQDIRKFGKIFLTHGGVSENLRILGPDPFQLSSESFERLFKSRKGRIKSLLLNQRIMAGLGNIYADESLHRAGIHPMRRPYRLASDRLRRLYAAIRDVLAEAITQGGSSIDDFRHVNGESGRFQKFHRVYGRDGQQCTLCRGLIRRRVISGRSAHYCPKCQR